MLKKVGFPYTFFLPWTLFVSQTFASYQSPAKRAPLGTRGMSWFMVKDILEARASELNHILYLFPPIRYSF